MLRLHKRTKHGEIEKQRKDSEIDIKKVPTDNNDNASNENKLENGRKKHISKIIKCNHCDKKFNKESRFKEHMKLVNIGLAIARMAPD